jgi:nucleoside-diphosphate-sugar epimerase
VNGINKMASEMYYRLYASVHGLATVSLRLTNTFGPRMDLRNLKKGFVGVFINQALAGKVIRVYGDGAQRRDFNYISDVVQALMLAGSSVLTPGQSFNLGHDQHHSLLEFLETLNRHIPLRYECIPFPAELQAIDIGSYYANYDKFFRLTGWRPQVDLDNGLRLTAQYYAAAQQPARKRGQAL